MAYTSYPDWKLGMMPPWRRYSVWACVIAIAAAAAFAWLSMRNAGIYPFVFADEYYYSRFARLLPLASSTLPDYLYLWVYRSTNACGDGFLGCARTLNILFFLGAAPLIYGTARRLLAAPGAAVITLLAVVGPLNSYTAYFMPEAMYFFAFWLASWYILGFGNDSPMRAWGLAGLLIGVAALVKPHALFLLPAVGLQAIFVCWDSSLRAFLRACANTAVMFVCAIVVKLALGYLLAGKAGFTLFGSFYSSVAGAATSGISHYFRIALLAAQNLKGHVLALALLYALPVGVSIWLLLVHRSPRSGRSVAVRYAFYAMAVLSSLLAVVSMFTGSVGLIDSSEGGRIHQRYYDFVFPLLAMLGAPLIEPALYAKSSRWRGVLVALLLCMVSYALYFHFASFRLGFVDGPSIDGYAKTPLGFYGSGVLSIALLLLWLKEPQLASKVFLYVFLPITTLYMAAGVNGELDRLHSSSQEDRAGGYVKMFLDSDSRSHLVVVSTNPARSMRALFHIDAAGATYQTLPQGVPFEWSMLPQGKTWALLLEDHPLPVGDLSKISLDGFTLLRVPAGVDLDFNKSNWPGLISHASGLSYAESWGTWSTSSQIRLEFAFPLPPAFRVRLKAHAFGDNIGKSFRMTVGSQEKSFELGQEPEERVLDFVNRDGVNVIQIDVPSARSPKELGLGEDGRHIGLGLHELHIERL